MCRNACLTTPRNIIVILFTFSLPRPSPVPPSPSSNALRQVLRLPGHQKPLVAIKLVPSKPLYRAVTVDEGGQFRLWDITKTLTGIATCLQVFVSQAFIGGMRPRSIQIMHPGQRVVACAKQLMMFDYTKKVGITMTIRLVLELVPLPRSRAVHVVGLL